MQHSDDYVPGHSRKMEDYCLPVEGRRYEPTTIVSIVEMYRYEYEHIMYIVIYGMGGGERMGKVYNSGRRQG
jgi:hypothetical protein